MKQLLILLYKKNGQTDGQTDRQTDGRTDRREASTICNDNESKFITHENICTTHLSILFEYSVT